MKKNKIIFWLSTGLIALWEGVMPLSCWIFAPDMMTLGTDSLGYPAYFAYSLVIAKVLAVMAIVISRTPPTIREWAYAGLSFTLVWASISHGCVDKNAAFVAMPLFFLGILAISYHYRKRLNGGN